MAVATAKVASASGTTVVVLAAVVVRGTIVVGLVTATGVRIPVPVGMMVG